MPRPKDPLIIALDFSELDPAEHMAAKLAGEVAMLKVGLELFWAHGPEAVRRIGKYAPVFVDAKLHDIPNTVERASANIARLGVAMFNVHATGGEEMMRAALAGARRGADEGGHVAPSVMAVTFLSSVSSPGSIATSLALQARACGLQGVVVSGEDVSDVRLACGEDFCLAVPGIRPGGAAADDQVRVLTPALAMELGADYLIAGRAVTESADPVGSAREILRQLG